MAININQYFLKKKKLRPLLIAEISANHCGKKSLFLKSIRSAAMHGADLVKIQTYQAEDIAIKNLNKKSKQNKIWKLYSKAQTPYDWHKDAFLLAKKIGIELFSTPFSVRAVDFLQKFNVKIFKVSSFEITDVNLIEKIAKTKKPVIVSTGMANLNEIKACVKIIKKYHNKIILMHCVSGYPTPENQANLNRIKLLKKNFKEINIGISDHTNDIITSLASIPLGVVIIEKHFILSKKLNSLDKEFSITPNQFLNLSKNSKRIFESLGKGIFEIQKKEKESKKYRRSIFSIKDILKGEKFNVRNISTFRPAVGLSANYFFKIMGKKSNKNIKSFNPIFKSDLSK
jgi:pseudaminic acid synthase